MKTMKKLAVVLVVAVMLAGGVLLSGWGWGLLRAVVSYFRPLMVKSTTMELPRSPGGAWQLRLTTRRWYFNGRERLSHDLKAWHDGEAFLEGANLDPIGAGGVLAEWAPHWQDETVLAFEPAAAEARRRVLLTVENATGGPLPYVLICGATQAYYLFELPAGGRRQVQCNLPAAGEKVAFAIPGHMGAQEWPAPQPHTELRGLRITITPGLPERVDTEFLPFTPDEALRDILK